MHMPEGYCVAFSVIVNEDQLRAHDANFVDDYNFIMQISPGVLKMLTNEAKKNQEVSRAKSKKTQPKISQTMVAAHIAHSVTSMRVYSTTEVKS